MLPPWIILDPLLENWLREDLGRGDRSTLSIFAETNPVPQGHATWTAKADGIIAGLPLAQRIFSLLDRDASGARPPQPPHHQGTHQGTIFQSLVADGAVVTAGTPIAQLVGGLDILLMGERAALNLVMRLSGVASLTQKYVAALVDTPAQLVDTRKTTPGLRILEKYAMELGGATNHRFGLDDAIMLKDNHIAAVGGITRAVTLARRHSPFTISIEVETENLAQVQEAAALGVQVIMLDNMSPAMMTDAISHIRQVSPHTKIEASGNITLETIRAVAMLGVDYISTSAMVTRSLWLDLSMRIIT